MERIADFSSITSADEFIREARRFIDEVAAPDSMVDFTLDVDT